MRVPFLRHFFEAKIFKEIFQAELSSDVRKLEQLLDDAERQQRQLEASYETTAELLRLETERNALLETEILDGESLKEVLQRQMDENRDLKSELAYRGEIKNSQNRHIIFEFHHNFRFLERKLQELSRSNSVNGNASAVATPTTRFVVSVRQLIHDLTVTLAPIWARYTNTLINSSKWCLEGDFPNFQAFYATEGSSY